MKCSHACPAARNKRTQAAKKKIQIKYNVENTSLIFQINVRQSCHWQFVISIRKPLKRGRRPAIHFKHTHIHKRTWTQKLADEANLSRSQKWSEVAEAMALTLNTPKLAFGHSTNYLGGAKQARDDNLWKIVKKELHVNGNNSGWWHFVHWRRAKLWCNYEKFKISSNSFWQFSQNFHSCVGEGAMYKGDVILVWNVLKNWQPNCH